MPLQSTQLTYSINDFADNNKNIPKKSKLSPKK